MESILFLDVRHMQRTDTEVQFGMFSPYDGSNLYEHKLKIERVREELTKFGLSSNQAKVYMYLGKYGPKSAPEVFRSLDLPRTETYYILNVLQSRGIVTAECSSPTKYVALPMDQAIAELINTEKEKLNLLAQQEKDISQLWDEIPPFAIDTNESETERLQMMEGAGQIYSKIKNMIKNAKEIYMFGSEKDIFRFYHSDIIEMVLNSSIDARMILSPASKIPDFLNKMDKKKIRLKSAEKTSNRCFIIKDNDEAVLFLRNATYPIQNAFAIWSNSKSLIDSIRQLFDYSWESTKAYSNRGS
jgi:HTH-type transcriptional regulator, sugar sensing transcriptional regulator